MWSVRLTDAQRDAVAALIEAQGEVGPSLTGAAEALDFARWDDLPEAQLPWERVTDLASAQGISEADVVWDLACAGLPTPAPAKRKSSQLRRKASRKPA
jgi:hypothetical protein